MTHYETLGVAKDADAAAIKKAWRKKASKAHTDRDGGDHSQMVAINRAYETLSDPEKRARYDSTGEDRCAPPLDTKATEIVIQLVMQMLEQASDHEDVIVLARCAMERSVAEIEGKRQNAERQAQKLTRKRKRLTHKASRGRRNFVDDVLAQRIGQLEQQAAHMNEGLQVFSRAMEMLEDYSYKPEQAPPSQAPQFFVIRDGLFYQGSGG
jgi:curved DNA-binding protein CbpA